MRAFCALLVALAAGAVVAAPVASGRLSLDTQTFFDELRRLPSEGKLLVSFTHPWVEDGVGEKSLICNRAGKVPRLYYTDFMFLVGNWHSPEYYARCRGRMSKVIRNAYAKYGSVPVFSWHCENPYAPKGLTNAQGRAVQPYRYRWGMAGYPEEHRYVMREFITPGSEMERWYEWRLEEIASFLRDLKTEDGRLVPCVIRPFHECEIDWWWGPKMATVADYVAVWRKTAAYLREHVNGGSNLLFCFSPDRYWKKIGEQGKGGYLDRYPGDDVVDIMGFDDYSIGHPNDTEVRLAETIRKMRLVSAEAARRGKVFGLAETGRKGRRDDFYALLLRALAADGVSASFVNTWGGEYTYPDGAEATESALRDFREYIASPRTVFAGDTLGMEVSFGKSNEVLGVRVGTAEFATGGGDLWAAEFASIGSLTNRVKVSSGSAASFASGKHGGFDALFWHDIPLGGEHGVLDARVLVKKRPDGSQAWRLEFDNRSARWVLFSTEFPRLACMTHDGEGDAMLPANDHGARLFRKRVAASKSYSAGYLGYAPMVSAFFMGDDGLYFAAEDSDARIKSFSIEGEQNVCFRTPVELGAEGPGYDVVLAPLKGDWWAAAWRYKDFALKQKWCAKGMIKDIPTYPRRICEIPLWINIHGHPDVASNVLVRAKAIFPDFSVGLHWHLWQHSGHDVNYPEYFPEQPGTKECIAFCESIGQEPMPYTNGRLWSAVTAGYLMAKPFAVMRQDGSRHVEKYAPWTPPLAVMCPSRPEWHLVMRNFAKRVLDELGARSIFIDQIGAAEGCACYDSSHGHPVGGGAWWYDGYEKALAPIRRAYNAKGSFLTTEGSGEAYIGMVDGFLQVVQRTPEDVPFHNAVYSGYTTYFCSPENNDDGPAAFRALQTRELLWGNALGWFLPDILDKPDKCTILRELCAFRQKNLDVLAYGNLLDELRFSSPVGQATCEWLGRRPHYRLFDKSYKLPPSKFATMPDVIGNWWRRADGKVVLLAANLTDRPQRVEYLVYGKGDETAEMQLQPFEISEISIWMNKKPVREGGKP